MIIVDFPFGKWKVKDFSVSIGWVISWKYNLNKNVDSGKAY